MVCAEGRRDIVNTDDISLWTDGSEVIWLPDMLLYKHANIVSDMLLGSGHQYHISE